MENDVLTMKHAPIEVTTHNIYFHEESPILSTDGIGGIVATCGYDKVIRLWKFASQSRVYRSSTYRTAADASVSLEFHRELGGFSKPINCIRFYKYECASIEMCPIQEHGVAQLSDSFLLAGCSDGGRIVVYDGEHQNVVREGDGDDAYELCWGPSLLMAGFASGRVEMYRMERKNPVDPDGDQKESVTFILTASETIHSGTVQGMAFNSRYGLLATHSLDRSVRVLLAENNGLRLLSVFDKKIDNSRSLFKRLYFADNSLYVFTKPNAIQVYSYPFRAPHLQKRIGPLNSPVIKVVQNGAILFVCTKKSIYVLENDELVTCIDNATFMAMTDAFVMDDILFVSSMDGFLATVRLDMFDRSMLQ